jgi:nucleoside-diphosphate-sugar epimerase
MKTVLVTGSKGLIGRSLCRLIEGSWCAVRELDIAAAGGQYGDVRDGEAVMQAAQGCCGIVHLAAVSRVIWGERDPALCREVNGRGTANVLLAAQACSAWVLLASSREVYGEPVRFPVHESDPLVPINVYGETKIAAECAVLSARQGGLRTGVVRLSNVYGDTLDHADRVTPAFARAAASGEDLRLDGADHVFDFTHVDDVSRAVQKAALALDAGERSLPAMHFCSGVGTRMDELAKLAVEAGGRGSKIVAGTPRTYDVGKFVGDPGLAARVLGWRAEVMPQQGVPRLVKDFAARRGAVADVQA